MATSKVVSTFFFMKAVLLASVDVVIRSLAVIFLQIVVLPIFHRLPDTWQPNKIKTLGFKSPNFTHKTLIRMWKSSYSHAMCPLQDGSEAPDVKVASLEGAKEMNLFDFKKRGRMFVVNFGSCS